MPACHGWGVGGGVPVKGEGKVLEDIAGGYVIATP